MVGLLSVYVGGTSVGGDDAQNYGGPNLVDGTECFSGGGNGPSPVRTGWYSAETRSKQHHPG